MPYLHIIAPANDRRQFQYSRVALDRICGKSGQHDVRERVSQAIVRSARSGKAIGALTEEGEKVLWRTSDEAA